MRPRPSAPILRPKSWGTLSLLPGREDISSQAHCSIQNLEAILKAAGSSLENVIKTTCFLADMADFAAFNAVYEKYFSKKPARSCIAVKELPKGALCEIEAIAEI